MFVEEVCLAVIGEGVRLLGHLHAPKVEVYGDDELGTISRSEEDANVRLDAFLEDVISSGCVVCHKIKKPLQSSGLSIIGM